MLLCLKSATVHAQIPTTSWLLLGLISAATCQVIAPIYVDAVFNRNYDAEINYSSPLIYQYSEDASGYSGALRVTVTSLNATESDPILVLLKRQHAVLSWPVPLVLEDKFQYSTVSRIICPMENVYEPERNRTGNTL